MGFKHTTVDEAHLCDKALGDQQPVSGVHIYEAASFSQAKCTRNEI